MKYKISLCSVLLLSGIASMSATQTAHALQNNASINKMSAGTGQLIRHTIKVPAGATGLSIATSGGSGDADLYVRYGSKPTISRFDCRPYNNGNRESCSAGSPRAGTYHIMVRAYRAFSGVSLRVSFTAPADQPVPSSPVPAAPAPTPSPATPAPAPATPAPATPAPAIPVAGGACLNETQQQLLDAHNAARAQGRSCGGTFYQAVPPVQWSCPLGQAATAHSNDMASVNFFSHTGSNGTSAGQRISATGYTWRAWGENIAAGQQSVESVMQGWIDSPGHCRNIMSSSVTEMGGARTSSPGADYSSYWTVVFARPQ